MNRNKTITIGIAAHNEEKNIFNLIYSVLGQKLNSTSIEKIIIVSDGSTDKTVEEVKKIKDKRILLINKQREGKGVALDIICNESQSNILVLFDGDIVIKDKHYLEKLIRPLAQDNIDLTSGIVREIPSKSIFSKIIASSMALKKDIYSQINHGNNIYTCHGRNRALSKKLYKKLEFRKYIADDAYSYLFALKNGYKYHYVPNASVYYKVPTHLADHLKQSYRFIATRNQFDEEFGEAFVKKAYSIPKALLIKNYLIHIVRNPFPIISYSFIMLWSSITSQYNDISYQWSIAGSSKK